MSIWNKILLGFICLASLAFFYLALRTLKTHQYWRDLVRCYEQALEKEKDNQQAYIDGGVLQLGAGEKTDTPGIKQVRLNLHKLLIDRGRVWYNCAPKQANPQTGQVAVTTELPDPHGIRDKTVLFVFEEANVEKKGRYLGEFKVAGVGDKEVQLEPTMKLSDRDLQRLAASKGPWTLYEVMPIDNHGIFADMNEAKLKAMLPADVVNDYAKDEKPLAAEDADALRLPGKMLAVDEAGNALYVDDNGDPVRVVVRQGGKAVFVDKRDQELPPEKVSQKKVDKGQGKYVRSLRDYEILFRTYHVQRSVLVDMTEATTRDLQYTQAALAGARQELQAREREGTDLKAELAKYARHRAAVVSFEKTLQERVAALKATITQMIAQNKATAEQIARIQLDATRRIDERARALAAGAGEK